MPVVLDDFSQHAAKVRSAYPHAPYELRTVIGAEKIDLRLTRSNNVDMCRLMVQSIYDKAKAAGAVNDDHDAI